MAPTPQSIDTIEPSSNDDQDKSENASNNRNIYTNQAFISDEMNRVDAKHRTKANSGPVESEPEQLDFDDILPHVGEFGKYQKILFLLMIPFAFFVAFVYFTQIFITLVPERHWCRIPELEHLDVQQR